MLLGLASSCLLLQAGDKVKALKCLIRSGDTDKIIFFAGVSRHAEIYTLAANYLQTLDWHARPDLAQSIVTFYSKVSSCTLCAVKHAAAARAMVNANKGWAGSVSQASACRSPDRALVSLSEAEALFRCTYRDRIKAAHGTRLWQ